MYSLVIPPKHLEKLAMIREATGVSIRRQVLEAIERQTEEFIQKRK